MIMSWDIQIVPAFAIGSSFKVDPVGLSIVLSTCSQHFLKHLHTLTVSQAIPSSSCFSSIPALSSTSSPKSYGFFSF
jgi:hypothetical protein